MNPSFHRAGWVAQTNIYEVNLRQYTQEGTFAAFAREMPRLKDMGIETLWFMPITPISLDKRKGSLGSYYACADYTATNPEFGSVDDFKQLVQSAHGMGFKVIIDWVANHTGWDHRWTREHPDFYRKNQEGHFYEVNGWEDVIDLNYDNPAMRQAMVDAMSFWIKECDIDGFRCDMAMLVPLDFWRQARTAVDMLKKDLFWLAECEEIAYHDVFDATYAWQLLHKMEAVWRHESPLNGLDDVLRYDDAAFPRDAVRAYCTSNHDENSHSGSEYERMGDAAKAFAVLCCTWNGVPLIYSGQELPNLKRLQFFDKDPIAWTGQNLLHGFYKALLELKKRNPALRAADDTVHTELVSAPGNEQRCFAFYRKTAADEVLIVLNISPDTLVLNAGELRLNGSYFEIFTGGQLDFPAAKTITLSGWGYMVLERR